MRAFGVSLCVMLLTNGLGGGAALTAPPLPLIPLATNFSYFDHHWIHWLSDHPVYESIEAESYLRPDGKTFIRVFLTERAGGKKQVFYFNDEEVAKFWRPAEAHFREIEFAAHGAPGEPPGLHVKLKDKDDQTIEWTMSFAPGTFLGKENQILTQTAAHGFDTAIMFLFYGNSQKALRSEIHIGEYHAVLDEEHPPKPNPNGQSGATHSSSAHVPLIALGATKLWREDEALATSNGRRLKVAEHSDKGTLWRSEGFGVGGFSTVEVSTDSSGAVQSYRHSFPGHEFRFDFGPPLPSLDALKDGDRFQFRVTMDDHQDFVTGILKAKRTDDGADLEWQPQSPEWLGQYPWVSAIHGNSADGYSLVLKRKP